MLKWVVTRAPQTVCDEWETHKDHLCMWNKENQQIHLQLDVENNNNVPSMRTNECYIEGNSPSNCNGLQRADAATKTSHILSDTSPNSTASSFRYLFVDTHSSPLKIMKQSIDDCVPRCTSRRTPTSNYRQTARRRQRRRLSSLDIREPSELASPSYRQADDPANDLSVDVLLTPPSGRLTTVNLPISQWKEVLDMYATVTEHYNEREIKTPEAEGKTMPTQETRQLVRRRAVRRKKNTTRSGTRDV